MGAITFPIRTYLDSIVDIVSIKTGLILTYDEILSILKEDDDDFDITLDELDNLIRIRSETFEHQVRYVRVKIGNLTKEQINPFLFSTKLIKWVEKGIDLMPVLKALSKVAAKYPKQKVDPNVILQEVKEITNAPEILILEILIMYAESQYQSSNVSMPERKEWKGGVPLQDIFKCEINTSKNGFLEQSFLDYLAVNSDKLVNIHWRNFERFCAEFFKRQGYVIELGPGTNDGGIDIRAYDKKDASKPIIIIQCKRYKEDNKVDIETVKSFYTDVIFEGAQSGMIVTTSYIAKGGRKVCAARGYPLSFAEKEDVKKWASSMWTHAKGSR